MRIDRKLIRKLILEELAVDNEYLDKVNWTTEPETMGVPIHDSFGRLYNWFNSESRRFSTSKSGYKKFHGGAELTVDVARTIGEVCRQLSRMMDPNITDVIDSDYVNSIGGILIMLGEDLEKAAQDHKDNMRKKLEQGPGLE